MEIVVRHRQGSVSAGIPDVFESWNQSCHFDGYLVPPPDHEGGIPSILEPFQSRGHSLILRPAGERVKAEFVETELVKRKPSLISQRDAPLRRPPISLRFSDSLFGKHDPRRPILLCMLLLLLLLARSRPTYRLLSSQIEAWWYLAQRRIQKSPHGFLPQDAIHGARTLRY